MPVSFVAAVRRGGRRRLEWTPLTSDLKIVAKYRVYQVGLIFMTGAAMFSRSTNAPFSINAYSLCLLVLVAADFLLFEQSWGMAQGIFAALIQIVLWVHHPGLMQQKPARYLWVAGFGLIFTLFLDPGPLAVLLLVVSWVAIVFCVREGGTLDMYQWKRRYTAFLLFGWLWWFRDCNRIRKWNQRQLKRQNHQVTLKFPSRLIPIVLGGLFLFLFYHANPIYAQVLDRVSARFPIFSLNWLRWLFWVLIACWTWAFLKFRLPHAFKRLPDSQEPKSWLDPQTTYHSLVLFNLIFGLHTCLDITYLWGGYQLPPGISYASFAHRGAYLLVATIFLAGWFILSLEPGEPEVSAREHRQSQAILIRRLLVVWVAQNFLLTFSAVQRLNLYVSVYGLTRLRLATLVWIGLVSVGLVLILWRYLNGKSKNWLVVANLTTLTAVLYTCCFINFEATIARYNLQRVTANPENNLDAYYLSHLGPKALPPLLELGELNPGLYQRLEGDHLVELILYRARRYPDDWRNWSWRHHQAFSLVEKTKPTKDSE